MSVEKRLRQPKVSDEYEEYKPDPPLDLSDDAVALRYCTELGAARRLAQLRMHELYPGLCFEFDLTPPPVNPNPRARPLPHFPPSRSTSFRLARPLQSVPDKNSQVWTAVAESDGAQTTAVLKIIQPSLCRHPVVDDRWSRMNDYIFPSDLARGEAWAYDRLEHMQGLGIPYFFGLHTITTPSGERAWVLVLEYVPGETLSAYSGIPARPLSDSCDLIRLTMAAMTEFMADGWFHNGLMPQTILVTGSPGCRSVVFIDLHGATHGLIAEDLEPLRLNRRRRLYNSICECLATGEIERRALREMNLELVAASLLVVNSP
ncbi:hypothetical protein DFH06DRAFT_1102556 [Mycena polygramma]|nr:hypothetical protein DFH06DRAFT_1102556 [Mycena polygramma]